MIRKYTLTCLAALTLICIGCTHGTASDAADTSVTDDAHDDHDIQISEQQMQTVGIELGHIVPKDLSSDLRVSGILSVDPQHMATVTPLLAGTVRTIAVHEGAHVTAGTAVATIENIDIIAYQQDYRDALINLDAARNEKTRQETLASEGAGIRKNLEKAQSDYLLASSRVKAIEQQLKAVGINIAQATNGTAPTAAVRTPISGIVSRIHTTIGGYADTSTPLVTITDNTHIYATLNVYEKDLAQVQVGQAVDMTLTNGNANLQGTIETINPTIDPTTKAISLKVSIATKPDADLIPGMAVTAYIHSDVTTTDALPEDAIASVGGKDFIYLLEQQDDHDGETFYRFTPIEVLTGNRQQGFVEVKPIQALSPNATVVTHKAFYLASMAADHGEHNH